MDSDYVNTHPALRVAPNSQGNPSAPSPPTTQINGEPPPPQQQPPDSPKSSRGRSFSFLRRSRSGEPPDNPPTRSLSTGRKLVRRKSKREEEERRRLEAEAASNTVPALPTVQALPNISNPYLIDSTQSQALNLPNSQSYRPLPSGAAPIQRGPYNPTAYYQRHQFSMDRASPSMAYGAPAPPDASPPGSSRNNAQPFDPFARTESMTNRGRMSYASSAVSQGTNGPRRLRRRKDPTPFNVLVIGTKGCGKSSFIEFLRSSLSRPVRRFATSQISPPGTATTEQHGSFTAHYLKTELDGERIGLTLYDSKGLERHLVDLQLREISAFVESKFQETFQEEQKVMRATGVKDTHIHCVFLLLDPSRVDSNIAASNAKPDQNSSSLSGNQRVIGGLDEDLDVDVIRTLRGKTTIIPVVSKADTVTTAHMAYLKRKVFESLRKIKFDPLEALNLDSDGESDIPETDENTEQGTSDRGSSIFHDVEESNDSERLGYDQDGQDQPWTGAIAKGTLDTSKPPQHREIRVSHLSTNFESPQLPMSIISPDVYEPGTVGRRFPWGFADPYNSEHCDFSRLRESVFNEWRSELREASRERWYEGWRTAQMKRRGQGVPQFATTPIRPAQRAVSSSAAYGQPAPPPVNGNMNQTRGRSSGEVGATGIGVAIGGASQTMPSRYRIAN